MGIPIHQPGRKLDWLKNILLETHTYTQTVMVFLMWKIKLLMLKTKKTDWVVSHLTLGCIFLNVNNMKFYGLCQYIYEIDMYISLHGDALVPSS